MSGMGVRPPVSYRERGTFYRRCIICWVRNITSTSTGLGGILDDVRDDGRSALLLLLVVLLVLQGFVQKYKIRFLALMKNQR